MVRKRGLQLLSSLVSVLLLVSLIIPTVLADEVEYTQEATFWHWLNKQGGIANGIVAYGLGKACPESPDGYHHSNGIHAGTGESGYFDCICRDCGTHFMGYETDVKQSYNDYVTTLPATGYTSAGGLSWKIVPYVGYVMGEDRASGERLTDYVRAFGQSKGGASTFVNFVLLEDFVAPIDGTYSISAVTLDSYLAASSVGSSVHNFGKLLLAGETVARAGTVGSSAYPILTVGFNSRTERCYWYGYVVISCVPHAPLGADTYNINTRPGSLVGLYGDVNVEAFSNNSATIINETNNTYYNPATGQTVPISNWSYDYSDRSYKVTLESGDTAIITYGDENITIQEGDTVYNVYYLVDGSGNPPCEHDWQEGEATVPTCVRPGSASYVCSKCQQEKTESIPALGHNWQVKQTVTTQYDDTGQLVQAGYTIFECSTCHEQYKSADGTAPPGGGSGTDPGGEEKETIWQKIGKFFGTLGNGVLGMIEAVVSKLLDGLNSLAEMLVEKLKTVVETVLSIFDELPKIFGGFLDFLAAVFPFLPAELMTILTFGIIAVVFIGIIKAVRR